MKNEFDEKLPENIKNLISLLKERAADESEYDDIMCIAAVVALDDEDNINNDLIDSLTEWINDNPFADISLISDHLFSAVPYSDEVTSESA